MKNSGAAGAGSGRAGKVRLLLLCVCVPIWGVFLSRSETTCNPYLHFGSGVQMIANGAKNSYSTARETNPARSQVLSIHLHNPSFAIQVHLVGRSSGYCGPLISLGNPIFGVGRGGIFVSDAFSGGNLTVSYFLRMTGKKPDI